MRVAQQLLNILLLSHLLRRDHVTKTLVYHELLMVFEVFTIFWYHCDEFNHVRLEVRLILLCKHMLSQLRNLQESFCGHILYTWMLLMHEFIQLLDDRLKEGPVFVQEIRKLTDNIHDI